MPRRCSIVLARTFFLALVAGSGALPAGCTSEPKAESGDSDTSSETGGSCEVEFEQAAPGTSGTFTVRNDRDTTIYILSNISTCTWEAWQLLDGDTQVFWDDDAFIPTCQGLLDIDCIWGCSDGPTTVIKLDPGAEWQEPWGYYVWTPVTLDAACVEGTTCMDGTTCWAGRAKLDGQLTARLRVSETCDFVDNCDCGSAACLIDGDSLSIGGAAAETVDIVFDASLADIPLMID